ncbi:RNA recognition motif (RRM)-containing protein [Artemisia annua]|uniref:RNA recognition motif (RRM)-containing protein n=1 Tax=Artemisia annua TaxID=35608 RepID=A0A2U1KBB2_ARTAN|nr:RNA recognition motif (RRM)-containing protein [Artemisia annua]
MKVMNANSDRSVRDCIEVGSNTKHYDPRIDDNYYETNRIRRSRSPCFDDNRLMGRFQEKGPNNMLEQHSRSRERMGGFHDLAPHYIPRHNPHQGPIYDDQWDLPKDALVYHGEKKLKSGMLPHEPELPEYSFSESE